MARRRVRDALALAAGVTGVVVTARTARRGLAEGEHELFRAANTLPHAAYEAIWVPMQYGTFGTVPAVAGLALLRRRPRLAAALAAGGASAWVLAKVVKRVVERERPHRILERVQVRGKEEGDLGYPSGHAAVSAALSTAALPYLPAPAKLAAAGLAGFVSFARIYVGAHLPLDVVGGASLGVALSSAANLILGVEEPSASAPTGSR
jgi:undecaprenyl-diphosphatase